MRSSKLRPGTASALPMAKKEAEEFFRACNYLTVGRKGFDTLRRTTNMLGTILLIVLILMLLGALPTWPHSRSWGYYPSGGLGMILLILIILILMERL